MIFFFIQTPQWPWGPQKLSPDPSEGRKRSGKSKVSGTFPARLESPRDSWNLAMLQGSGQCCNLLIKITCWGSKYWNVTTGNRNIIAQQHSPQRWRNENNLSKTHASTLSQSHNPNQLTSKRWILRNLATSSMYSPMRHQQGSLMKREIPIVLFVATCPLKIPLPNMQVIIGVRWKEQNTWRWQIWRTIGWYWEATGPSF